METKVITKTDYSQVDPQVIESLVLAGDLSKMNSAQRVSYYNSLCQSLGLNPLTQPFQILKFQGKEVLYARKDATEQLRRIYGVSVVEMVDKVESEVYIVKAKVQDAQGRYDIATGAVPLKGLQGEAKANAMMKAETKAKRRATLSICGLGMLDESELDTIGKYETVPMTEVERQDARIERQLDQHIENTTADVAVAEPERKINPTQQAELLRLLDEVSTPEEKNKMVLNMPKMTEARAAVAIDNLKKKLAEKLEKEQPMEAHEYDSHEIKVPN